MPSPFVACVLVALGGALGALARYGMHLALQGHAGFPWGTLGSNLLGCLVMGAVVQFVASHAAVDESGIAVEHYRLLFAVGFCGSFTTLSAFIFDMSALLQRHDTLVSFAYFVATFLGGFACFWAGVLLTRALWPLLTRGSA